MGEGFVSRRLFNSSISGFSNLDTVYGSIQTTTLYDSDSYYNLYVNNNTYQGIYAYQDIGSNIKDGLIFTSPTTSYCSNPDLLETASGNILFPSEKYIGRGVRFTATGGSTTTIVDTTRNFTDLGIANGDTVTNLKTGTIYTITSITTTTNTNDTLNFTASGTETTTANDEIIAWEYDRFNTSIIVIKL